MNYYLWITLFIVGLSMSTARTLSLQSMLRMLEADDMGVKLQYIDKQTNMHTTLTGVSILIGIWGHTGVVIMMLSILCAVVDYLL